MKRNVEKRLPTNEQDLSQAIIDAFRDIPEDHFKNLMDSMKNRIKNVTKLNGAGIKY